MQRSTFSQKATVYKHQISTSQAVWKFFGVLQKETRFTSIQWIDFQCIFLCLTEKTGEGNRLLIPIKDGDGVIQNNENGKFEVKTLNSTTKTIV